MKIYYSFLALFVYVGLYAQEKWSFDQCLSYAHENNLQILASKLNEQTQEYNYKIAKNQKLPTINGEASTGFSFGPQLNNVNQLDLNNPNILNSIGKYEYTTTYRNSLGANASVILYNKGNLKLNEDKNYLLLQQNQFTTDKISNDISLRLVADYLTILLNKELSTVSKNSMDTNQKLVDMNQKMYNAGSIPLSILYESKANLATAKQHYENSKIEVDRARLALAILLQKDYDNFDVQEVHVPNNLEIPLSDINNVIQYAFEHQPEIKSAKLNVEASKKDLEIPKTANYPTVTANYQVGTSYMKIFNQNDYGLGKQWYDNHSQTISLGLTVPIFNKGINNLKIQQSQISQQIQQNNLEQQKLVLKQTIQSAYFDVNSSYQTFLSAKETVKSTQISYEFAEKGFNAGKVNIYDLNTARNNYYNAQSQMLQAKYSFLFKLKILNFYAGIPLNIK